MASISALERLVEDHPGEFTPEVVVKLADIYDRLDGLRSTIFSYEKVGSALKHSNSITPGSNQRKGLCLEVALEVLRMLEVDERAISSPKIMFILRRLGMDATTSMVASYRAIRS